MYSPRSIRPHSITLRIKKGENENKQSIIETIEIKHCRVNYKHNPNLDKKSRNANQTIVVTIDMSDLNLRPCATNIGDGVIFNAIPFTITSIKHIYHPTNNKIAFVELTCVVI